MHASPATSLETDPTPGKYLTFKLGPEEFGIPVVNVREIMGIQQITALPQTPDYLKGVINLHGKMIHVIDLRLKLGLPAMEYTQRTCIVVVQVESEAGPILVGVVVDAVSKVLNVTSSHFGDTPGSSTKPSAPFILGIAKLKGKMKFLLDIDRVVNSREISGFERRWSLSQPATEALR